MHLSDSYLVFEKICHWTENMLILKSCICKWIEKMLQGKLGANPLLAKVVLIENILLVWERCDKNR